MSEIRKLDAAAADKNLSHAVTVVGNLKITVECWAYDICAELRAAGKPEPYWQDPAYSASLDAVRDVHAALANLIAARAAFTAAEKNAPGYEAPGTTLLRELRHQRGIDA